MRKRIDFEYRAQKVEFTKERRILVEILENVKSFCDTGVVREKIVTKQMAVCRFASKK